MKSWKRIVCIGDSHSGSQVGLTPPKWETRIIDRATKFAKFKKVRQQCWNWYQRKVTELKKPDILLVLGDMIDGRGEKSGGLEQLTTNRQHQVAMATECIKMWEAKKVIMVYGTPYHTGEFEDWENDIAYRVDATKIGSHEWIKANNVTIDIKHYVPGGGGITGLGAVLEKEILWNLRWATDYSQPRADILIRGHLHEYYEVKRYDALGIILPALQAMGSKYGSRCCRRKVDFGFIELKISSKGDILCQKHIASIKAQKAKAMKL